MECRFCEIVSGNAKAHFVFEDDKCIAFMDAKPVNDGHVIVVPKKHEETAFDIDDETLARMFRAANAINFALRTSGIRCEGVNYILVDGNAAFNKVAHVHLHVFPRLVGDNALSFGRARKRASKEELERTAKTIKRALDQNRIRQLIAFESLGID